MIPVSRVLGRAAEKIRDCALRELDEDVFPLPADTTESSLEVVPGALLYKHRRACVHRPEAHQPVERIRIMKPEEAGCWVGVDWGDKAHTVSVVGPDGRTRAEFGIAHEAAALKALPERLRGYGPIAGVAVETPRHLLVHVLAEADVRVYPINPKLSKRWRECKGVAGAKDDRRDAWALADGLRCHHAKLRVFVRETGPARVLSLLCEDESRAIGHRTALVQQMKDALKQYFPGVLEWFDDWTTQAGWDFVAAFPTPAALASAKPSKLIGFLRTHRMALTPQWQERIAQRHTVLEWPCEPEMVEAKSLLVVTLAKQLRTLQAALKSYRKQIEPLFDQIENKDVFASLPGAGPKLAPRLASLFGQHPECIESADVVQKLSGTAPVTVQSGGSRSVHIRRACRKNARNTLHQFAGQSIRRCAWARALYDRARRKGQKHATALRLVANKWLKIIYRMWQTGEPYDEQRYLDQLVKTKSPIAYELGLLKT
jgi:hypothetical protein